MPQFMDVQYLTFLGGGQHYSGTIEEKELGVKSWIWMP